jgi:hypothetical protein
MNMWTLDIPDHNEVRAVNRCPSRFSAAGFAKARWVSAPAALARSNRLPKQSPTPRL